VGLRLLSRAARHRPEGASDRAVELVVRAHRVRGGDDVLSPLRPDGEGQGGAYDSFISAACAAGRCSQLKLLEQPVNLCVVCGGVSGWHVPEIKLTRAVWGRAGAEE
jgi:hypothetical protein